MTLHLIVHYHCPNPRNLRRHWTETVREKHKAQDALLSALCYSAAYYSTLMQSTELARICSTASLTLDSYRATGRVKSTSTQGKKRSRTGRTSGRK